MSELKPHVAIAFKRLFPRVAESALIHFLHDSDNVRADLEWFMMRYPLEHVYRGALAEGAANLKAGEERRNEILMPDWTPGPLVGFRDGYSPYLYQSQAAKICVENPGLLLGDDVGLGKTISAFALALFECPMPICIVVESHLQSQWTKRAGEFMKLRVHEIKTRKPYTLPVADIYIYRYSNLAGWVDVLNRLKIPTVVWDEIHQLRHGLATDKGRVSKVLADHAQVRLGLSATPIYNYGDEIHSVMGYIEESVLGDRVSFMREWCNNSRLVKDPDALGSFLQASGYFLRRDENDATVDASMPPPNVIDIMVDADDSAIEDQSALMRSLAISVMGGAFKEAGQAARELDIKMRMITGVAKARSVAAYVRMLLNDCDRVMVAGWHRQVYDIWNEALAEFNPVMFTGSESAKQKDLAVARFCNGNSRVLFMSLRSGAGLDGLQHFCRDGVIGELDWSPMVHKQFFGRIRRPGQQHQINAHYVHTNWGSDPVIMEMLGIKSDQSRGIIDPGKAISQQYSDQSRIKRLAEYVLEKF